jgi:hypothetical protein
MVSWFKLDAACNTHHCVNKLSNKGSLCWERDTPWMVYLQKKHWCQFTTPELPPYTPLQTSTLICMQSFLHKWEGGGEYDRMQKPSYSPCSCPDLIKKLGQVKQIALDCNVLRTTGASCSSFSTAWRRSGCLRLAPTTAASQSSCSAITAADKHCFWFFFFH